MSDTVGWRCQARDGAGNQCALAINHAGDHMTEAQQAAAAAVAAGTTETGAPAKFCVACGTRLDARAELCPSCGVRQPAWGSAPAARAPDRLVAALLAIFLGGLGIHKFYLGKTAQGVVYLIFCWTGIPAVMGLIEGILYLVKSDKAWAREYGGTADRPSNGVVVGCLLALAVLVLLFFVSVVGLIFLGAQVSTILSDAGTSLRTTTPAPIASDAGRSPVPSLDAATVSSLEEKVAADPNDTTSLLGLANAYFQVQDYQTAAQWAAKAVAVDPTNVDAYLALGASQYNLGDEAAAETAWKQAVTLDPNNVEAHYDLGFLYYAAQPQDTANAIAEWQKVIALDPTSDLATSLKAHLAELTGSPAP